MKHTTQRRLVDFSIALALLATVVALAWLAMPADKGSQTSPPDVLRAHGGTTPETMHESPGPQEVRVAVGHSGTVLSVRVLDQETGNPIPEAEVRAVSSAASPDHGAPVRTDSMGACKLFVESSLEIGDWLISSSADGYQECTQTLILDQGAMTIRMTPRRALRGRVRLGLGGGPAIGVAVLAKESDMPGPTPEEVRKLLNGASLGGFRVAFCNDQGVFELESGRADTKFDLRAGGAGYLTSSWIRGVIAGGTDAELIVEPAFAARLRVTGPDGVRLRLSPAVLGVEDTGLPKSLWSPTIPLSPIPGDLVGFVLATGELPPKLEPVTEQLLVLIGAHGQASAGPIHLVLKVPGYFTKEVVFDVRRMLPEPDWLIVQLIQRCNTWGNLSIAARDSPAGSGGQSQDTKFAGYLVLSLEDREDWIPLDLPLNGAILVEGLPGGTYHAHVRNLQGVMLHSTAGREDLLTIGQELAELELDLSGAGGIELSFADSAGSPYQGWTIVTLSSQAPTHANGKLRMSGVQRYAFAKPPYLVPLLGEGTYHVAVQRPMISDGVGPTIVPVEVSSGQTQQLALPWVR